MVFSTEIVKRTVIGDMKMNIVSYTNTLGDVGGTVDTGLRFAWWVFLQPFGAAAPLDCHVVDMTIPTKGNPMDGTAIPIITTADESGLMVVIGK